ncbi:MAG: hypothetical protein HY320_06945 [Armatimonadetes bacterium]|nr:hypothetical protein [Armatimonadota bacterium]
MERALLPLFGLRAILIAVLLTPVCAYWATEQPVDMILSLIIPPVSCLLILVLLNAFVYWARPRWALTTAELLITYGMLQAATAIASEWMIVTNPLIAAFAAFETRNPKFGQWMLPNLPDFLFLKDATRLADYQTGGRDLGYFFTQLPLWMGPIFWWTLLFGLVCGAMLCINVLMRQEWTEREKLSFPLIQLPLAMTHGGPSFWRNRLMWTGLAGIFAIDMLNGFAFLYPSLPSIPVRFLGDLQRAFPDPPFNAIGWTPIGLFPFIVGLSIFLPTDLMFSVLFFFFMRKTIQVIAASMGYPQGVFGGGGLVPSPPYFNEQSWGAFLGLFFSALWVARGYLRKVWSNILFGARCPQGGISPRWACAGLVGALLGLGWFGTRCGLSFGYTVVYLAIFLAFSTALTRMRAQLGPPTHEMAFMGPNQLLVDFHGTQGVSTPLIARTVAILYFTNRSHRTHPMPSQLELMKMGERTGTSQKLIFFAILLAIVWGSVSGHVMSLLRSYRWGARYAGADVVAVVNELVTRPRPPNTTATTFVGLGMAVVFVLNFIRFRLPWFPLHPMGYALSMNFGVDYYWFGIFVAWVLKASVQRYVGLKGYQKLHHLALGVILGEMAAETIWASWALINRYATYTISINGRLGWNQ